DQNYTGVKRSHLSFSLADTIQDPTAECLDRFRQTGKKNAHQKVSSRFKGNRRAAPLSTKDLTRDTQGGYSDLG
ncbi:MAG: hypothetical protein KC445_21815, partial [Anaerolineales bacterium]|nr:hypothetical protein [Anaerolineales bacterium]